MRAVGITCGIGSMLVGARAAGFKVVGNVEWRQYYHEADAHGRNTFKENYPGAEFPTSLEQMTEEQFQKFSNPDLALGHPECGNFSRLSGANKNRSAMAMDPADIPLFVEIVAKLKPRFFVMDDLPGSFVAYPMEKYAEKLPEYDLFPEWISNWGYGNVQKGRDRMFMLGALKSEKWVFVPGEEEHDRKVKDVLEDLPAPRRGSNVPNHDPHDMAADCSRALNIDEYRKKHTWASAKKHFADKPGGYTPTLTLPPEEQERRKALGLPPNSKRIGFLKAHWDGPSHVLTGGNAILHNLRCDPYTIRERARIQGFPDDFVFYGTVLNDKGEWNYDFNTHMVKQTGKAMPVQFCTYVSKQVAAKIRGEEFTSSRSRVILPNQHVDEAKRWYCQEVGYANQAAACGDCWLAKRCAIRTEKYGFAAIVAPRAAAATRSESSRLRPTRSRVNREAPVPPLPRPKARPEYREVKVEAMSFKGGS